MEPFSFDQVKDAWTEHGKWKKMKSFNTEFFGFCICIESFGNSSINHIACKETTMPPEAEMVKNFSFEKFIHKIFLFVNARASIKNLPIVKPIKRQLI